MMHFNFLLILLKFKKMAIDFLLHILQIQYFVDPEKMCLKISLVITNAAIHPLNYLSLMCQYISYADKD